MKVGYARVSTLDQNLDAQQDDLFKAGCLKIFKDKASGAKENRTGLQQAMQFLKEGDVLVVWKLDRLGRSLIHLLEIIKELNERKVGFMSLQENIDTSTSSGKLIFHIFSSIAEFERDLIRDRTKASLMAARARGRIGGRPRLLTEEQVKELNEIYEDRSKSVQSICKQFNISRPTLYSYLSEGKNKYAQQN
jgi:DNA invertase Pin-like site-specific DNA recombinase